jgi:hypothetical protein
MTVQELINILVSFPKNMEVVVQISEDDDVPITEVVFDGESEEIIIETI